MKFIAIDFETANANRNSPCEIGVVKVENAIIVERKNFLIKPKDNYFDFYNTYLHGIDADMVKNEPEFDEVYKNLKEDFENYPILAHNAAFDISVLRHTLDLYGIEYPETEYSCTYQLARESIKGLFSFKLDSICSHFGIILEQHHRALPDAIACAEVAIRIFQQNEISSVSEIENKFKLKIGKLFKGHYRPSEVKGSSYNYKISDLQFDNSNFKPDSPFFDKTVVFTGTLQSMIRKDAQVKVLEIGGRCGNDVTTNTDYLIVGEQDYKSYGEGFKSSKMKKAEKFLSEGNQIEMITEGQFLELIYND